MLTADIQHISPTAQRASPSIRSATPSDAPAIAALLRQVWTQEFGHSLTPSDLEKRMNNEFSMETVAANISNPQMRSFVATIPAPSSIVDQHAKPAPTSEGAKIEQIIGQCLLILNDTHPGVRGHPSAYVRCLFISPSHTNRGLGAEMMRHAEHLAAQAGCASVHLCVWDGNVRGKRFYAREGYAQVGEVLYRIWNSPERRDYVMEKMLD